MQTEKTWLEWFFDSWKFLTILGALGTGAIYYYRRAKKNYKEGRGFWLAITELTKVAVLFKEVRDLINQRFDESREAYHQVKARLDLVTDVAYTPYFRANCDGEIEYINDAFCDLFGKDRDELLGDGWLCIIAEKDFETVNTRYARACKRQTQVYIEFDGIIADDSTQKVKFTCKPYFNIAGICTEFQGTAQLLHK